MQKLSANLNYLGYPDDFVPLWSYSFLRSTATNFINQAKGLEREALGFLGSAENEQEQNISLRQSVSMGYQAVQLENLQLQQEQTSWLIAQGNEQLAELRFQNKTDQVKDFSDTWKISMQLDSPA